MNLTEFLEEHGKGVVSQYGAVCNSVLTILREHLIFFKSETNCRSLKNDYIPTKNVGVEESGENKKNP